MTIEVKVGATHKQSRPHIKVAGSWRSVLEGWHKVDGVWRRFYVAVTVEVVVLGFRQVRVGGLGDRYYDEVTFGVSVSGGGTPASYSWSGDVGGSGATAVFIGPIYDLNGWTQQVSGTAQVSVVVGGQTYTASRGFSYTSGDIA